ncbi:hypothetical protein [Fulvimarina sp. MAC3]|uniref:GNAT family N-acetyltransferase n=1 Tax=Fulvimarina sp. MAC3 TaxID=3148887 RepID=UPI0031FBC4AB
MTDSRKPPKSGRKAFKGMAPKGYVIRMMEPGEVPALLTVFKSARQSASGAKDAPDIHAFTRHLLAHEVFVAIDKTIGEPVGYAAAAAESDLYWLSELSVDPGAEDTDQLRGPLLKAVAERAHWFFYRALGHAIGADAYCDAAFYVNHGFVKIPEADLPAWLNEKRLSSARDGDGESQVVMLKWL